MNKSLSPLWKFTALSTAMVMLSGCASIISGTKQEVSVNSVPSGANVKINGMNRGQTPIVLDLKRMKSHTVRIEMDGYQPYDLALSKGVNGWVLGNVIFGGLIGLVIDAVDGAIYTIKPDTIQANLVKNADTGVAINGQEYSEDDLQKVGQMERNAGSISQQLIQLKSLKDDGILTEVEYETKRKELVQKL